MAGTMTRSVTPEVFIASSVALGGIKEGRMVWAIPQSKGSMPDTVYPKEWKLGRTFIITSPSCNSSTWSKTFKALSIRFPWLRGTAFGSPVVPEVAKIIARSGSPASHSRPTKD